MPSSHQRPAGGGALVADLDGHQVLALDGDGGEQWRLGEPGRPRWQEPFNHPTHALEWPDGGVWVSDGYGNTVVHRFDAGRRWLGAMGEPGDGPLQFSTPHMLARAADGTVLVADRENHRVQRLDGQGRYLGELRPVHKPMAVAVLPQGCPGQRPDGPPVAFLGAGRAPDRPLPHPGRLRAWPGGRRRRLHPCGRNAARLPDAIAPGLIARAARRGCVAGDVRRDQFR
ncbi:hypothetical protein [Alcaligenes sp. Marseille-Q7550]